MDDLCPTCIGFEYADPGPEEMADGDIRIEMCKGFPFLMALDEAWEICRGKYWKDSK